jgi:hypothetical protein
LVKEILHTGKDCKCKFCKQFDETVKQIISACPVLTKEILHTGKDCKCKFCKQFDEKVKQIISACPALAKEIYIKRRDRVCAQIYFNLCKEIGVKLGNKYWYNHGSKSQVMKLNVSYYGTNKRETTEVSLTILQIIAAYSDTLTPLNFPSLRKCLLSITHRIGGRGAHIHSQAI